MFEVFFFELLMRVLVILGLVLVLALTFAPTLAAVLVLALCLLACSPACLRQSQLTRTSQRGRGRAKRGPRPTACALGKVFQ